MGTEPLVLGDTNLEDAGWAQPTVGCKEMLSWGLGAHTGPSAHRGHFAVLSIGTKNAPFWLSRQIIFWLIFLSSPEAPEHSLFCGGREQRKKKKQHIKTDVFVIPNWILYSEVSKTIRKQNFLPLVLGSCLFSLNIYCVVKTWMNIWSRVHWIGHKLFSKNNHSCQQHYKSTPPCRCQLSRQHLSTLLVVPNNKTRDFRNASCR